MRILIAEDEAHLQSLLKKRLTASGYAVDAVGDGEEAAQFIEMTPYDLIILDWMLPNMDGISLLKKMRGDGRSTPVLLLTAKDSIEDRVAGLDAGADDYLIKPFAFDELLARLRVLTRRQGEIRPDAASIGDLTVDFNKRAVRRGGKDIALSGKEFAILAYMMRNREIVLSREKIERHIWSYDFEGDSNVVNVYIRYLRKKIDDGFDRKLIHTVRGAGYVLKEDV